MFFTASLKKIESDMKKKNSILKREFKKEEEILKRFA